MTDANTTQCVLFPGLFDRPLVARFDQEHGSSDGGAVLLKAVDAGLRLTARLAACLPDDRQPGKIRHELLDLLRQRVYAIACGYPDGNDAARLADDPVHKMLVERDPIDGDPLASQPTLSRFENAIRPRHLYLMGEALADVVIERQRRRRHGRARRITLELDPTDDPTHGGQQLTFFNGHYDTWCYLPVAAFVRFNDEAEQHLVAAVLRPGNANAGLGALGILRRLLARLYHAFPEAPVLVRLDGGFATPEILDYLDGQAIAYVVAMAKNSVLKRLAEPRMKQARLLSQGTGETEHLYGECRYAARSWPHRRRVIFKAEVVRHPGRDPKDNPRFVITNLSQNPQWVYERVYCQRGEIENRIKELHHGLEIDRTSCSSFWANQLRVLMTAAAYVLMQELRHQATGTVCARAQVGTLRERLIKIGVRIEASVRRIVLHLPSSFPYLRTWRHVAHALGARAG
jgi:hypothetical protein